MKTNSQEYEDKCRQMLYYSSPAKAKQNVRKVGLNPNWLYISTRQDKKYMYKPTDGRAIHFGSWDPPMVDYLKHGDRQRLEAFQKRNHRWRDAPRMSPSWLSYWVLWS
jgi:hypothetical protein